MNSRLAETGPQQLARLTSPEQDASLEQLAELVECFRSLDRALELLVEVGQLSEGRED